MVKGRYIGDGHPTFNRNPYNGYINPYYWVDEFIPYYMEIMGVGRPWHIWTKTRGASLFIKDFFKIQSTFKSSHSFIPSPQRFERTWGKIAQLKVAKLIGRCWNSNKIEQTSVLSIRNETSSKFVQLIQDFYVRNIMGECDALGYVLESNLGQNTS